MSVCLFSICFWTKGTQTCSIVCINPESLVSEILDCLLSRMPRMPLFLSPALGAARLFPSCAPVLPGLLWLTRSHVWSKVPRRKRFHLKGRDLLHLSPLPLHAPLPALIPGLGSLWFMQRTFHIRSFVGGSFPRLWFPIGAVWDLQCTDITAAFLNFFHTTP